MKFYNGPYIDDWLIFNTTVSGSNFLESLVLTDESISINSTNLARLSYGKYFDLHAHRPCKVDRMEIKRVPHPYSNIERGRS